MSHLNWINPEGCQESRRTLINTIFHRTAFQQVNLYEEGRFIQPHTTEFAEANRDKRLYRQFKTKQRRILQGQEVSPHGGTNVARYKRVTPCPLMFLLSSSCATPRSDPQGESRSRTHRRYIL